MPNDIAHFAIHADDCDRAKRFYEGVFGWTFTPWGPPDFWVIETSPGALRGALQKRPPTAEGSALTGYECTVSVEDVESIQRAISAHGGAVTMPPFLIEGVGTLVKFRDTEGNEACAMQYLSGVM
ncbi:MAG: VOC family protein [Planctomycetota bacterium]